MFQIGDTLVSIDLAEQFFCCDLDACKGECCIEGDAGAPITREEYEQLKALAPSLRDEMLPAARREIDEQGVGYIDEEGDLVTSIIEGKNCVFTCYDSTGCCQCLIEKAHSAGRSPMRKPISCYLYPVRITEYPSFTAVNYHRWKICRPAEKLGRRIGMRLYRFLERPLTERFGAEWYRELRETCEAYIEMYNK